MSDTLVFYTNPQSRGRVTRWLLEEIGQPYRTEVLDFNGVKAADYLAINPMGKVPAIVHRGRVVTENAAICLYLADAFPEAGLAPPPAERADYYRWMFFAAGPMEAAFSNKAAGFTPPPRLERMFGYGTYDHAIDTLEKAVSGKRYIASDQFSVADLYVSAMIGFMLDFKLADPRPAFTAYIEPLKERPAYRRAAEIDNALIAAAQPT